MVKSKSVLVVRYFLSWVVGIWVLSCYSSYNLNMLQIFFLGIQYLIKKKKSKCTLLALKARDHSSFDECPSTNITNIFLVKRKFFSRTA